MRGGGKRRAENSSDISGHAYDARLMKRLMQYLKPMWVAIVVSIILLFGATGTELASPWIIKRAIDEHVAIGNVDGLGGMIFLLVGVMITAFVFRFLQTYLTQWIGQRVIFNIRTQLFNHLQKQDLKFVDSHQVGWLMTRLTADVQSLYDLLSQGIIAIFGDLLTLAGIVIIMLMMDVKLALVSFIVVPMIILVVYLFRKKVRVTFRIIREARAVLNGFMQEHISGIRTAQIFVQESAVYRKFQDLNRKLRAANVQAVHYFAMFFPVINFLSALAVALILLVGGLMIRSEALSWGALVAFLAYSERFFRPIRDLSERYNTMQVAMTAAERIFWLLDSNPEIVDLPEPKPLQNIKGEVKFEHVTFEYKVGEPILKDISFDVKPGETVAIVGATGAGKTTLITLLQRLWDVTEGSIKLDGVNIREYRQAELRRSFGVVSQDVFLFSGTIAENVTLGDESYNGERLQSALKQANASDFIDEMPDGVNEIVGERGARLSGGQKQLLAIARALATNPPVLLLDEATAAIDTETERKIQEALDKLMIGRTTLVVAHRLSTIRNASKIIVIHKGKLVEMGTHDELMELDKIYARLFRMQFAENVEAVK